VVLDGSSVVEISFRPAKLFSAQMACDNISIPDLLPDDRIRITMEPEPFRMLHPKDYEFFAILRAKLNWSSSPPV
jgi:NAD+ kinase